MPDPKKPPGPPVDEETVPNELEPDADADEGDGVDPAVAPNMTLQEIKDAGLQVDLPFESGSADPKPLKYADLGPEKKYTGPQEIKVPTKPLQSWDEA